MQWRAEKALQYWSGWKLRWLPKPVTVLFGLDVLCQSLKCLNFEELDAVDFGVCAHGRPVAIE